MSKLHATFISMAREPFQSWLSHSIIGRAQKKGLVQAETEAILESVHSHHEIDDTPYGGGPGELLKIDVIAPLIKKTLERTSAPRDKKRVLLMDPSGISFEQKVAERLLNYEELIFVSGRYEGIDARIYHYVDEAISLGDFVLSSGDLAALAIFDAIARLHQGVLGNRESIVHESHQKGRLECSHYTRPLVYDGREVPLVLKSGDHKAIEKARLQEGILKTQTLRPDLLMTFPLTEEEKALLLANPDNPYPWQKIYE